MNHNCEHGCKHANVKYCEKCQKCYCLDCGKEWPQYQYQSFLYPQYPFTYPEYTIISGYATTSIIKGGLS